MPVSTVQAQAGLLALSLAGVGFGLYGFFHRWKQRRWLEETPESRVRSAAQGYVRLTGRAQPAPIQTVQCGELLGVVPHDSTSLVAGPPLQQCAARHQLHEQHR